MTCVHERACRDPPRAACIGNWYDMLIPSLFSLSLFSLFFFSILCYSLFRVIYLCLTQFLTMIALYGNPRKKRKTGEPGRLAEASVVGNTSASLDPCPALRLRALPNGVSVSDNVYSTVISLLGLLRWASSPEWTSIRLSSHSTKDRYGWTMACWGHGYSSVIRAYA